MVILVPVGPVVSASASSASVQCRAFQRRRTGREYLVSVVKEGLEALYCLSMHDLLFKMVPLNNCFYKE